MNLSLAIDPFQLAAPLLSSLAGTAPAEGEDAENGFATMLAGVEPKAAEAESSEVEAGTALPIPGNSLPPVLLPIAVHEFDQSQQLPMVQSNNVPAPELPSPPTEQPKPAKQAMAAPAVLQPIISAILPGPMPMGANPAKPETLPLSSSSAVAPVTAPAIEIAPKSVVEPISLVSQKSLDLPAGQTDARQVMLAAPAMSEQASLPSPLPQPQSQSAIQPIPLQAALNQHAMPAAAPAQPGPQGQLESLIDSLVQARESGRSARGEIVLRHAEFGAIAVKLDQGEGDMLARISSRDPGFAPAAQAALAERQSQAVAASTEGQSAQNRSQDGSAPQGQSRDMGFASQQDRSGSSREQRPATTSLAQLVQPQRPSTEQRPASPNDGSVLA